MFGRGFATAGLLILIALGCLAVARRLDRERRLLRRLRAALAGDGRVAFETLTDDDRDTVQDLREAGVVQANERECWMNPAAVDAFKRRRLRLALSGAIGALALCIAIFVALIRR